MRTTKKQKPSEQPLALSLTPWKRELGLLYATGVSDPQRGVFGIRLHIRETPFTTLREAMELLCLAVYLDLGVLRDLLQRGWLKVLGLPIAKKPTDDKLTELLGGERDSVPIHEILFTAQQDGYNVRLFHEALTMIVPVNTTTQKPQRGSPYQTTRTAFLKQIKRRGLQQRLERPVQICVFVNSLLSPSAQRPVDKRFHHSCLGLAAPLHVQDFFVQLFHVATHLREYRQTQTRATGVVFQVDHVELTLSTCFAITPCIVETAHELMQADECGRVVCNALMLDPRMVACTPADLVQFTRAISHGASELTIELGFIGGAHFQSIDHGGEDRTTLISALIAAVAACERLKSVNVGPLLSLLTQPRNRECVWRSLVEVLLSSTLSSPLEELRFVEDTSMNDDDGRAIVELTRDETRPVRAVGTLHMEMKSVSQVALSALMTIVRNLDTLFITTNRTYTDEGPVGALARLAPHHATLRSVQLTHVDVESMAIFSELLSLESLELQLARVTNQPSVGAFFQQLADPSNASGKRLHTLVMSSMWDAAGNNALTVDTTAATSLVQALGTSNTLRSVSVMLADDVPTEIVAALESHHGDIVPHATPEFLVQKTACLSVVYAKAQETSPSALAQFDAELVHHIFSFSSPSIEREVDCYKWSL